MISTPTHIAEVEETTLAPKPLVLVLHASVGSGHRSAAQAVGEALRLLSEEQAQGSDTSQVLSNNAPIPDNLDVEVLDILDFGRIVFDGNKAASMFTGASRPIYDLTWRFTLTGRLLWGGGTAWNRIMYNKFTDYVSEKKPLAIICTHITAANAAVGARMITGQKYPILCVPTDYEVEGMWPHQNTDLFCVANEAMAETLRPRKVPEECIAITGIPTREDFRRSYDRERTREELKLPQNKMIVLALAGAYLPQPYVHFRTALDKILPYLHSFDNQLHFVFVAGNDEAYARHLRAQCSDLGITNVTVLDYVKGMAGLMAASDLVICKSGGLTVTECLCSQTPMVLLGRAYGQEKANTQMLTSLGAAFHATTWRELLDTLRHVARQPESVHALLVNGSLLRYPNAARDVAQAALNLSSEAQSSQTQHNRKRFLHFYWGKKPAHLR